MDFVSHLEKLLEKANYEKITESDLNQALNESYLFNIRLHVDFDDFSEVLLFSRGESIREEQLSTWFGLSSQPVELNKTAIMTLLAGIAALGGYLWKQFNSFKNRKLKFMQSLTQNLYFKNLDNNAGVFHKLANDAEDEDNHQLTAVPIKRAIELLDKQWDNYFIT